MSDTHDALELLTAQHEELGELFRAVSSAPPERRALALGRFADRLMTHLAAEQELLYPTVDASLNKSYLTALAGEHDAFRQRVVAALSLDVSSDELDHAIEELGLLLAQHVRSQDEALFVTVAEAIPLERLTALAVDVHAWSTQSLCIDA
jgi:hypothetical protein